MSDLTSLEKRKLERALGMRTGYVLGFSNRTFEDFFADSAGIEIYSDIYELASGSKANRMRAFWEKENNHVVGSLLLELFENENWTEYKDYNDPDEAPKECVEIALRLKESTVVPELEVIQAITNEKDFEALAKSVRESIERNEPETGLDRLHTFLVKYFRIRCQELSIEVDKKIPLHSLFGQYIKAIKKEGLIESEMSERILKSTISIMESFSHVRNNQSFAHDNQILNYSESLLIFGHVTNSIRFIERLKKPIEEKNTAFNDIPF